MMAVNGIKITVFTSLMSTVVMFAKHIDSGWISGNQTVTQYNNVVFTCYSDHSLPAEWWFSHNDSRAVPIYLDKIIQPRWREKYDIAVGSNFYNLSIISVSLDNDGRYECREGSGVRNTEWHSSFLRVNDIDECAVYSPCDKNAKCRNTVGGYTCTCNKGFAGIGFNINNQKTCHELSMQQSEYQHRLVGGDGMLTCRTNDDVSVIWQFVNTGKSDQVSLYHNGEVMRSSGWNVTTDNVERRCGKYDIKLNNMQLNHSGWYLCIEQEGKGSAHRFYLNVTGLEGLEYDELIVSEDSGNYLNCRTSFDRPVVWFYAQTFTSPWIYLFENGFVNVEEQGKFGLVVMDRLYDINLHQSQMNHTGYYICVDNNGMGKVLRSYELKAGSTNYKLRILTFSPPALCSASGVVIFILTIILPRITIRRVSISLISRARIIRIAEVIAMVITALMLLIVFTFALAFGSLYDGKATSTFSEEGGCSDPRAAILALMVWVTLMIVTVVCILTVRRIQTRRKTANSETIDLKLYPHLLKDELVLEINPVFTENRMGNVSGLTVLKDELFIVRCCPTNGRVEVYHAETGVFKKYIEINGLGDEAYGLTSCAVNNCLYISDSCNKKIHKVQLPCESNNDITSWLTPRTPFGLSVDQNGNIVVACNTKLFVFDGSDVSQPFKVSLGEGVSRVMYAMPLRFDRKLEKYLVSCWEKPHVCVVNAMGKVVRSFDVRRSSATEPFFIDVRHLAVHNTTEQIFVADFTNDKVYVFDGKQATKWFGELKVTVNRPHALCFDQQRSQLYIGEWCGKDSRIVVVKIASTTEV